MTIVAALDGRLVRLADEPLEGCRERRRMQLAAVPAAVINYT